jgi:hypothetical protein
MPTTVRDRDGSAGAGTRAEADEMQRLGVRPWAERPGYSAPKFALEPRIVTVRARQLQRALTSRLADGPHGKGRDMGSLRSSSPVFATVSVAAFSVQRLGD